MKMAVPLAWAVGFCKRKPGANKASIFMFALITKISNH